MPLDNKTCFCCSELPFKQCCKPALKGEQKAVNALALMRSRFTAYMLKDYFYIFNTYAEAQRLQISVKELSQSAQSTDWLSLQIINHRAELTSAQVEFKAYYKIDRSFYVMHELSDFILEKDNWRYTTGEMLESSGEIKPERNSQCLCGNGKNFKKCCGK
ncbi:MAG: YchJ family metal-binding protein [Paraglaciecola sp.]|uniref:YchJ family protein n=1 Tax=Paraglaciecola sp. TaxID=1920173 RepID=UPI0032981936